MNEKPVKAAQALLTGLPAADAPVRLCENTGIPLFAVPAAVWMLCRALWDALACYAYDVPG